MRLIALAALLALPAVGPRPDARRDRTAAAARGRRRRSSPTDARRHHRPGRLRHAPHAVGHRLRHARHRRRPALDRTPVPRHERRVRRTASRSRCPPTPSPARACRRRPRSSTSLAIQRGTGDPNRVIVISGHIDSRVTDVMNSTADAPGANDDASGVAAVLEAARVLSKHRFDATLVYAVLSGEEQGLLGGKILADYAEAQGWVVEANLNNDIVGNSAGPVGRARHHPRPRLLRRHQDGRDARRRPTGGATTAARSTAPSRNLARFVDGIADRYLTNFDVEMVYRTDRFGRGGDQVEMLRGRLPRRAHHRGRRELRPPAPGPAHRERRRLRRHHRRASTSTIWARSRG